MSVSSAGSSARPTSGAPPPARLISAYQRDVRARVLRELQPRRHGIHRRAEGRRDTGKRVTEQEPRPGLDFDRMRAAAPQADGLHVLQ